MQRRRATTLTVAALLVAGAIVWSQWPEVRRAPAASGAGLLEIRAEQASPGRLVVRMLRPNGAAGELRFERNAAGAWRPADAAFAPGVAFGDGYPVFATPRFLASVGLPVKGVLKPMSPDVASETAEDVTVLRGLGDEVVVCLWNRGKVTRAWVAGETFERMVAGANGAAAPAGPAPADACGRLAAWALAAGRGGSLDVSACEALIAGCPQWRPAALEALVAACERGDLRACDALTARGDGGAEPWPEVSDFWRWVLDLEDAGG